MLGLIKEYSKGVNLYWAKFIKLKNPLKWFGFLFLLLAQALVAATCLIYCVEKITRIVRDCCACCGLMQPVVVDARGNVVEDKGDTCFCFACVCNIINAVLFIVCCLLLLLAALMIGLSCIWCIEDAEEEGEGAELEKKDNGVKDIEKNVVAKGGGVENAKEAV